MKNTESSSDLLSNEGRDNPVSKEAIAQELRELEASYLEKRGIVEGFLERSTNSNLAEHHGPNFTAFLQVYNEKKEALEKIQAETDLKKRADMYEEYLDKDEKEWTPHRAEAFDHKNKTIH